MWIDGKLQCFPLNRENILMASCRLAPDFERYIDYLCQGVGIYPEGVNYIQKKAKEELELRQLPGGFRLEIEDGVLKRCRISKLASAVRVPEGVTAIGSEAFTAQAVREVYIPDSVTDIGSKAFNFCTSLISARLPGNISELPERAFYSCYSLKNITIPESVRTLGEGCFSECYSLEDIKIPAAVREIGDNCFEGCTEINRVAIPRGVERLNWAAFKNCRELRSVFIPDTVTSAERNVFSDCDRLTELHWEGRVHAFELRMKSDDDMRDAIVMLNQMRTDLKIDAGLKYPLIIGMYRETGNMDVQEFIRKNYKKMAAYFIENDCAENLNFLAQDSELTDKKRRNELKKLAEKGTITTITRS